MGRGEGGEREGRRGRSEGGRMGRSLIFHTNTLGQPIHNVPQLSDIDS